MDPLSSPGGPLSADVQGRKGPQRCPGSDVSVLGAITTAGGQMPQERKDLGMNAETGGANVPQNTCMILARHPRAERSNTKGFPPTQFPCARFDAIGEGKDRAVSGTPAQRGPRQGGGCFAGGTIA